MQQGSKNYRLLVSRAVELRKHLLLFLSEQPTSKVSYSSYEFDLTRAYVILMHAEIEGFCEMLADRRIRRAKERYNKDRRIEPALRRIIAYHVGKKVKSWEHVLAPTPDIVNAAFQAYMQIIDNNHGIKRSNLEAMFYPLGLLDKHLDAAWMAQMDSFGITRGVFAHSRAGAQQMPDPLSQLQAVNGLLKGLLELDQRLFKNK